MYYVAADPAAAIKHFTDLGFAYAGPGVFFQSPAEVMVIGQSRLVILETADPGKAAVTFSNRGYTGICGVSISVSSLADVEKHLRSVSRRGMLTLHDNGKVYVLLQPYALFLEFSAVPNQ